MAFTNYTREILLKAMDRLGKPSKETELLSHFLQLSNIDKLKQAEGISATIVQNEESAIYMAFRTAVVDMIEQKILCHDKAGLLCLTEWMPDPKRLRSLDDDWSS